GRSRYVGARVGADAGAGRTLPFERQPEGAPVGLAGRVVVDASEADALEPPRGSRAHVSLVVVAVDITGRPRSSGAAVSRSSDLSGMLIAPGRCSPSYSSPGSTSTSCACSSRSNRLTSSRPIAVGIRTP